VTAVSVVFCTVRTFAVTGYDGSAHVWSETVVTSANSMK
jgi:hypothetical protein